MLCNVCKEAESKYRCPKCLIRYCTVQCYKDHKVDICTKENREPIENSGKSTVEDMTRNMQPANESEDRVAPELLAKLGESIEVHDVLRNPHLQTIIKKLDSSDRPSHDMEIAMQEPLFTEFVDKCLKIVEPPKILLDHT